MQDLKDWAIGNKRILSLQGDEVVFSARAKRSEGKAGEQGKKRTLRLRGPDFMAGVARVNIQRCPTRRVISLASIGHGLQQRIAGVRVELDVDLGRHVV
jgi:hypothetical protein